MKKNVTTLLSFIIMTNSFIALAGNKPSDYKIPYAFTENKGQIKDTEGKIHAEIKYTAQLGNTQLYFKPDGISYVFTDSKPKNKKEIKTALGTDNELINFYRTDVEFVGCNKNTMVKTEGKPGSLKNYYTNGSEYGITNVGSYNKIIYQNIYNNIDLIYTINESGLKYDFVVRPGGDPKQIQLRYIAADSLNLNEENGLTITNPLGKITDANPVSFIKETKQNIKTNFVMEKNTVSFNVENYDPTKTLIIDPFVRMWGTYFGGTEGADILRGLDYTPSNGYTYITGEALSASFIATSGAFSTTKAGIETDAYLAKFDISGNIIWSTYFGGSLLDAGTSISANTSEVIIGGITRSHDGIASSNSVQQPAFPTSTSSIHASFLAKFDLNGQRIWSTYFAGPDSHDCISDIDIEASTHKIIVCVREEDALDLDWHYNNFSISTSGLATPGAYIFNSPAWPKSFVAEFNTNGSLIFGTYMPNQYPINDVKFLSNHSIAMVGSNGFIGILNSTGSAITYSYSGLGDYRALDVDASGNIFVSGSFNNDALLVKYNSQCAFLWSTSYGNTGIEVAEDISIISNGDIFIGGTTTSTISTMVSSDAIKNYYNLNAANHTQECFISKFNSAGMLKHSTFYGSDKGKYCLNCYGGSGENSNENFMNLVADDNGNIVFAGNSNSANLNVGFQLGTPNAYQQVPKYQVNNDAAYENAGFIGYLEDNEISIYYKNYSGSPNQICAGTTSVTVTFSTLHNFPSINYFTLELSDAVGNFTNPTPIGFAYGSVGTTITGLIPANTPNGAAYKVRVKNSGAIPGVWFSNPVSVNSGSQFSIQQTPTTPVLFNNSPVCSPKPINFSAFNVPNATYAWSGPFLSSPLLSPSLLNSSTFINGSVYNMVVTVNGCSSLPGVTTITVNPTPVTRTITPSTTAKLCAGQSVTLTVPYYSGELFQWYKNGSQIMLASSNTYVANASGSYYVLISIGNCYIASSPITLDFGNCGSRLMHPSLANEEQETIGTEWKIYPNPTEGLCYVTLEDNTANTPADLFVFNNLGQLLFNTTINGNKPYQLNLLDFDAGSYIIKIKSGKSITTKSLIIAR
ncbi:MAG: T9SS type A sorting domain-containing protein [Bacteroidia bacterium]